MASLLVEHCKLGLLPNEKGNVPRALPLDASHQFTLSQVVLWSVVSAAAGGDVLSKIAKMTEDSIYDFLILYASNDPDRHATVAADPDIDGKNAFQARLLRI